MRQLTLTTLLLGVFLLAAGLPATAQNVYHMNYGGGRITKQNMIGLYHNDASYVSCGTLGQSARDGGMHKAGLQTGDLPTTHWGGYIRNPGDDIYNGNNGAMRQDNGSMVYGDEIAYINHQHWLAARDQRISEMLMQAHQRQAHYYDVPRGNYYVPGSNGGIQNYGAGVASYSAYSGNH